MSQVSMKTISSQNILEENVLEAFAAQKTESFALVAGTRIETGIVGFGQTGVRYSRPFTSAPTVFMAINGFDLNKDANARLGCGPLANTVTRDGFTANLGTWGDTGVHGASAIWIAIGND